MKTNKTIPMDQEMIDMIHELMFEHMKSTGKTISFGEATRVVIHYGIQDTKKRLYQQNGKNRNLKLILQHG